MSSFSWLHFTDLHFGAGRTNEEWGMIFSNLMDDVNRLRNANNLEFDALFFTGDMVNLGSKSEYKEFNRFLEQIKKKLVPDKDPIFLAVPGNHDLARPKSDDPNYYTLTSKWEEEKERLKIWNWKEDSYACKLMETVFKNYLEWWNDDSKPFKKSPNIINGLLPGEFRFSDKVNGLKATIIGLNSSFLHLHDLNGKNSLEINVSQYNKLFKDQFEAAALKKNHDIAILLTHHPVNTDFFNERGLDQYNKYIYPAGRFNVHLCGHVHENVYNKRRSLFNKKYNRVVPCCSLFGREKYDLWENGRVKEGFSRKHGYSIGQIEKTDRKLNIKIWPRTINRSLIFVKDTDLCMEDHKAYVESEDDLTITEKPIGIEKVEKISISKTKLKSSKETKSTISTNIKKIVGYDFMILIKKHLLSVLKNKYDSISETNFVEALVELDLLNSIPILKTAVEETFNEIGFTERFNKNDIWENSEKILGWLLLLSVDAEWIKRNAISLEDKDISLKINIPFKTDICIEIVLSYLNKSAASIDVVRGGKIVIQGKNKIDIKGPPPGGWNINDKVTDFKQLIFIELAEDHEEPPQNFGPVENEELKDMIQFRILQGESPYIVVSDNDYLDNETIRRLNNDILLNNMFQVNIHGDDQILVIPENTLYNYLMNFFRIKIN